MSEGELQSVTNFGILNEHGQITWEGFVDLTGVDLAKSITIEEDGVTVYDDEVFIRGVDYPPIGEKLNRPATIKLYRAEIELPSEDEEPGYFDGILQGMNVVRFLKDLLRS